MQAREFVFPNFVAAVGEGALDGIAIELAHLHLRRSALDKLSRHAFRRSVGDAFVADACAPTQKRRGKPGHESQAASDAPRHSATPRNCNSQYDRVHTFSKSWT